MNKQTDSLPPGPKLHPVAQLAWWIVRPISLLERCWRDHGEAFTLRFNGIPPLVVFSDPEVVREIFTGRPDDMHAGEANVVLEPLVGRNSLLILDGPQHLRERKLLLPPFHGERMLAYGETMLEITNESIDRWPVGKPFAVHDFTQSITLDIIIRTIFGLGKADARRGEVARLRELLTDLLAALANPMWLLPQFQVDLGRLTPWGKLVRMSAEIDDLLFAELRRRREQGLEGRDDILSMLMQARYEDGSGLSDAALRDEMMTLLVAGHETTATALAWTLCHVLPRADVREQIARERREVFGDDALDAARINRMSYLDATVREALRLRPVLPFVGRKLQRPMRIGGYDMPAGSVAAPSIYLTHRNPKIWPDPTRFEPRRFLERKVTPYEFLPFGGGVRRCIGMAFALYEMRLVLAQVLDRVEMTLAPRYKPRLVRRAITFAPSRGLPVLVSERRARRGAAAASVAA